LFFLTYNFERFDISENYPNPFANSMMGESLPPMKEVISSSNALKVLLPINICNVETIGVEKEPLPYLIEKLVDRIKEICYIEQNV